MATMFEYEPVDTSIHRLNPVTKLVLFLSIVFISGLYLDARLKIPLLLILIILAVLAKLPFKKYATLLWVAILAVTFTASYRGIFMINPNYFKVYPHDFVMTQLFQITPPDFPIIGRTAVTYGTLLWTIAFPLTTATVVIAMATLMHTTSQSEILQVMSSARLPMPAVFVVMVALRFIPEMIHQMETVQIAQRLRGWQVKSRNPVKIVRGYLPLLVPIARYVADSVDRMTISTKNRAFGLRPVTGLRDLTFRKVDYLVTAVTLICFATGLFLLIAFNIGTL